MGHIEEVQEQDRETLKALQAHREAVTRNAGHPSGESAKALANAAFYALIEIRKEIDLLRRLERILEEVKTAATSDYERRVARPLPAAPFPAPSATRFMANLRSGMLSPEEARRQAQLMRTQIGLHPSPPGPPRRYQDDRRPQEGRYQAPPPPTNERIEEWNRRRRAR